MLSEYKGCSDKNRVCLISKPSNEIDNINKTFSIEVINLTTIDKYTNLKT